MVMPSTLPNNIQKQNIAPSKPRKVRKVCPIWGVAHRFTIKTSETTTTLGVGKLHRRWKCKCGEKIWQEEKTVLPN